MGEEVALFTCPSPAEPLRFGPASCNLSRGGSSAHRFGQLKLPRTEAEEEEEEDSQQPGLHQVSDEYNGY